VTSESGGDYLALVIRLQPDRNGQWQVSVDGTTRLTPRPVPPTTLVVRLWRSSERGPLRGTLSLVGDDEPSAPIQTDARIEALLRAWLGEPDATTP
jgi:hypothetical protein